MQRSGATHNLLAVSLGLVLLALAACDGTAVVTLTATPSTDSFLAYRVGLTSVQLQSTSGGSTLQVMPNGTTVDLAQLLNVSEVMGAPSAAKGTYTQVTLNLDYSAAQIVYDDGTLNGVALAPVNSAGTALTQAALTIKLDPSNYFKLTSAKTSRLALDFKMAASNLVNLSANTVTVTPLVVASALPLDQKQVLIRGPAKTVNTTTLTYTTGVMPFDGDVLGSGALVITPADTAAFEVDGSASTGTAGISQLTTGSATLAYGSFVSYSLTDDTTTAASTATETTTTQLADTDEPSTVDSTAVDLSFVASTVLAGTSVRSAGLDRVSGVVTARNGNTLTLDDATLVTEDGTNTLMTGTTIVNLGANTLVTQLGAGVADTNSTQQISVGTALDAFGAAVVGSDGNGTLDASAGHVIVKDSTASGMVTEVDAGGVTGVTLNLAYLGNRAVAPFDFVGTAANPAAYVAGTTDLDLTNSTVGSPVVVQGFPNLFGTGNPDFNAYTLLDQTNIVAHFVMDWGTGTAAPFATYTSTDIDVDVKNSSIGQRHIIQTGAQSIDVTTLSSDPLISPNASSSGAVFAIAHAVAGTVENFDSFAAFITQLQSELTGNVLALHLQADGVYTASAFTFAANSVALTLNN